MTTNLVDVWTVPLVNGNTLLFDAVVASLLINLVKDGSQLWLGRADVLRIELLRLIEEGFIVTEQRSDSHMLVTPTQRGRTLVFVMSLHKGGSGMIEMEC